MGIYLFHASSRHILTNNSTDKTNGSFQQRYLCGFGCYTRQCCQEQHVFSFFATVLVIKHCDTCFFVMWETSMPKKVTTCGRWKDPIAWRFWFCHVHLSILQSICFRHAHGHVLWQGQDRSPNLHGAKHRMICAKTYLGFATLLDNNKWSLGWIVKQRRATRLWNENSGPYRCQEINGEVSWLLGKIYRKLLVTFYCATTGWLMLNWRLGNA